MNPTIEDSDSFWMQRALAEAALGRGRVEPNPMVGALLVRDGRLIAVGHHERFGGPHAEVVALEAAGSDAKGSTLFVTLEPCCHQGKTPPCVDRLLQSGVTRVVAAMRDPFPRVAGGGFARLQAAGVEVHSGTLADAARRLNAPYLKRITTGRPYVTAKWAMTLDGKTATANQSSRWISGPRSRAQAHEVRGWMDAIIVGIDTALADDPELTARPSGPRVARRLVLDSSARLPLESKLVRSARAVPVWVAVSERAPLDRRKALEEAGCELLSFPVPGSIPIAELLDELGRRGLTNLLVEGGGRVLGSFFDAGEVDRVEAYIAPTIEGGDHGHIPVRGLGVTSMADALRLERSEIAYLDGDLLISGTLAKPWLNPEPA